MLLVAALVLFGINLGELPLRDWDEGTVAQVARNIWRATPDTSTWLYPTLGNEPYLNKPPLMHGLMAIAYRLGGVNEWTSRLPGATLTALSVPLLYGVGREVFHRRAPALFAALVYLTFLPVARHGRLAMLDGAILCFTIGMMGCMLRARRDRRYALGVGLGLSLIGLTKGGMVPLLLGAIALLFLLWDTPRLLQTPYFWLGILLGSLPLAAWYATQWLHYGQGVLGNSLLNQSLSRIWTPVENHDGPPWYYLLELLKYGFPWLLFLPAGFRYTWSHRTLSWAKLALVWSGLYLIAVSVMATKLPWYILPLYPALALIVGALLTQLWDQGRQVGVKQRAITPYSRFWVNSFGLLALVSGAGCLYFLTFKTPPDLDVAGILVTMAIALAVTALLIARQNPQFIPMLVWGNYLALILLMISPHWVWELAEAYPVKPVAQLIQQQVPQGQKVYTPYPDQRPSLDFYSDRQVLPASLQQLKNDWQQSSTFYLLLDEATLQAFLPKPGQILGKAEGWTLISKGR